MVRKARAEFEISAESNVGRAIRETQQQLDGLGAVAGRAGAAMAGALAAYAAVKVSDKIAEVIQTADQFAGLSQRIRTATKDTGDFDQVMAGLLESAAGTGSELEATIDVFQSISRIRDDIGVTNQEAILFGRTLQQLGVIGGASTTGMANGLRQLSQSLAGGVVRAEEFNSLVENTPEIVARIAGGLDVTQGQLRQMVLDGKLLAEDVLRVILEQAEGINAEFAQLTPTIDRASATLGTAFSAWIGDLDQSLGLTTKIAAVMNEVAYQLSPAVDAQREQLELRQEQRDLEEQLRDATTMRTRADEQAARAMEAGGLVAGAAMAEYGNISMQLDADITRMQTRLDEVDTRLVEIADRSKAGFLGPKDEPRGDAGAPGTDDDKGTAAAERRIRAAQDTFRRIHDAALAADDDERARAELAFAREQELLARQRAELERHGQLTATLREKFEAAELEARAVHDERIAEIAAAEVARTEAAAENDALAIERVREMLTEIEESALEFGGREEELEELRFNRVLENLERERQALEDAGLLTEELREGFREAEANAETEHQARIAGIVRDGIDQRTKEQADGFGKYRKIAQTMLSWDTMSWQNRTHTVLGTIQELTAGMAQENEIAFRLNQAAGIANATMFVAEGVTRALKLGPKGIPLAAVIGALGAAEIATIASTSFGGGAARGSGTLSGVPSEAAAPFNAGPSQALPELLERDQNAGTRTLRIEFAANDSELARAMASNLRVLTDEDDVLLFSRESRQALELTT